MLRSALLVALGALGEWRKVLDEVLRSAFLAALGALGEWRKGLDEVWHSALLLRWAPLGEWRASTVGGAEPSHSGGLLNNGKAGTSSVSSFPENL